MGLEKVSVSRRIPPDVAVVIFGMDRAKKQHASRFGAATAKAAQVAAQSMGLRAVSVTTDEQRAIALKLPRGSVSAAGKATVPFVKPALYAKLLAVAGPDAPTVPLSPAGSPKSANSAAEGGKPAAPGTTKPEPISLAKGAVVLATDEPDGSQWWPATVQFIDGELLTLRWQSKEWKDLPAFIRRQGQVAVMPEGKPC